MCVWFFSFSFVYLLPEENVCVCQLRLSCNKNKCMYVFMLWIIVVNPSPLIFTVAVHPRTWIGSMSVTMLHLQSFTERTINQRTWNASSSIASPSAKSTVRLLEVISSSSHSPSVVMTSLECSVMWSIDLFRIIIMSVAEESRAEKCILFISVNMCSSLSHDPRSIIILTLTKKGKK